MIIFGDMKKDGSGPYPQNSVINRPYVGPGEKCCPVGARCISNIPQCPVRISRGEQCPNGMMWDDTVQNCIPIFINQDSWVDDDDMPHNTGIVPPTKIPPPILPVRRGMQPQEMYMVDKTVAYATLGSIAILTFLLIFGGGKKTKTPVSPVPTPL